MDGALDRANRIVAAYPEPPSASKKTPAKNTRIWLSRGTVAGPPGMKPTEPIRKRPVMPNAAVTHLIGYLLCHA
jgi:hypothetical protein